MLNFTAKSFIYSVWNFFMLTFQPDDIKLQVTYK